MLSSLPTELIREIIDSTVPHTFRSTTYKQRQRTLCSLSLVSKLFRSIAQPLLLEIVWVKSPQNLIRFPFPRSGGGGGGHGSADTLRYAIFEVAHGDHPYFVKNREAIVDSLRKFSSVKTLTITNHCAETINLTLLSTFRNLSNLQITGRGFTLEPGRVLNRLQSLSCVGSTGDLAQSLLKRSALSNLRALAPTYNSFRDIRSAFVDLLPQLDLMEIYAVDWKESEADFLRSRATSILIDCFHFDLPRLLEPRLNFVHVRLIHLNSGSSDEEYLDLDSFTTSLSKTPSLPLRSVYLDTSLQLIDSLPPVARRIVQRLLAACQDRDIDVVFEPIPRRHGIDPYLSEEFCRKQQANKRNDEAGARAL